MMGYKLSYRIANLGKSLKGDMQYWPCALTQPDVGGGIMPPPPWLEIASIKINKKYKGLVQPDFS